MHAAAGAVEGSHFAPNFSVRVTAELARVAHSLHPDPWDNALMGDGTEAIKSAFSDVDASGSGAHLIGYLDAARRAPTVAAAKAWSVEKLSLRPGTSVLDVGCGTGEDVVAMADLISPGGWAAGVDIAATMVDEARKRHGHRRDVEFMRADACELPFDSAQFDACRCERTLQHLDDPSQAVSEMSRVLRAGARITLLEPDWGTLIVAGAEPETTSRILAVHVRRHRRPSTGRQLRGLLSTHGFGDIELGGNPVIYTDLASANRAFGMGRVAQLAVLAGAVSEVDASRWDREIQDADANQSFMASVTSFRACARLGSAPSSQ
jgi:SAM-dependent methyltransferase